jgi:hypothetical protein
MNTLLSNYCTQRENVELLKYIGIMKAAPTCFGLQGNHHRGPTTSTWLKIQAWFKVDTDAVQTLSVLWRHILCIKYAAICWSSFHNSNMF